MEVLILGLGLGLGTLIHGFCFFKLFRIGCIGLRTRYGKHEQGSGHSMGAQDLWLYVVYECVNLDVAPISYQNERDVTIVNPLPTNEAHATSWTLHKPMGIYMGVLGVIFQYMVSASLAVSVKG